MEISSMTWLSDLGMEVQKCELMDSLDDLTAREWSAAFVQDFQHSFSSDSYSSCQPFTPTSSTSFPNLIMKAPPQSDMDRPEEQLKTNKRSCDAVTSSTINIDLSFGNQNSHQMGNQSFYGGIISGSMKAKNESNSLACPNVRQSDQFVIFKESCVSKNGQASKRVSNASYRSASHAQEHVIAERKRREKLSQRFIALSAILPGLKKVDKASVLSNAIMYLKQLQEKVKTLEERNEKKAVESMVCVKKSHICSDEDTSSSDEKFVQRSEKPEIEARILSKNILIRIHCSKQKGVLVKALAEIEQLQMSVLNTTVLPFSDSSLLITVLCKLEDEYCKTVEEVVNNLKASMCKFM